MHVCMWLHIPTHGSIPELCTCRNILIFPKGNREVTNSTISLYLNVADNDSAPPGWSRTAKFTLSVVDQRDPDKSASKGIYKPILQHGLNHPMVFTNSCCNKGSAIQGCQKYPAVTRA